AVAALVTGIRHKGQRKPHGYLLMTTGTSAHPSRNATTGDSSRQAVRYSLETCRCVFTTASHTAGWAAYPQRVLAERGSTRSTFAQQRCRCLPRFLGTVAVGNELSAPACPGNTCENA